MNSNTHTSRASFGHTSIFLHAPHPLCFLVNCMRKTCDACRQACLLLHTCVAVVDCCNCCNCHWNLSWLWNNYSSLLNEFFSQARLKTAFVYSAWLFVAASCLNTWQKVTFDSKCQLQQTATGPLQMYNFSVTVEGRDTRGATPVSPLQNTVSIFSAARISYSNFEND